MYSLYSVWTKPLWVIIHSMSDIFDKLLIDHEGKDDYEDILQSVHHFFRYLVHVIPCKQCQFHFQNYLQKHSPTQPFFMYSLNVHNHVNKLLNKSQFTDLIKYQRIYATNLRTIPLLRSHLKFYTTFCLSQNILLQNNERRTPIFSEWWFYYTIQLLYLYKYKATNASLKKTFILDKKVENVLHTLTIALQSI